MIHVGRSGFRKLKQSNNFSLPVDVNDLRVFATCAKPKQTVLFLLLRHGSLCLLQNNHFYHFRTPTCPSCRFPVTKGKVLSLYVNTESNDKANTTITNEKKRNIFWRETTQLSLVVKDTCIYTTDVERPELTHFSLKATISTGTIVGLHKKYDISWTPTKI